MPTEHGIGRSLEARAKRVLPAGVSSDARRAMPVPLYIDHARGSHLVDVDGNEYIDYVLGQGPMLLGHSASPVVEAVIEQVRRGQAYAGQHPLEVDAAEVLCRLVPCAEMVRFNSVGSEAVLGAWRIARGYTGRSKVLKFEGHYHGWLDAALFSLHPDPATAGPADTPVVVPGTGGQQMSAAGDLVIAPWNNIDAFADLMRVHAHEIAAVIMEPLLCNTGCIAPVPGFLEEVRRICSERGVLLIFDEVITGFRLAPGGAQEHFGVVPDLAVFGKALAGGLPVSAIAGSREVMAVVTDGKVGHAGTFNSNPVGMAATVATLGYIEAHANEIYPHLRLMGQRLMAGIREAALRHGVALLVDGPGSVFQLYFTDQPEVRDYRGFAATDRAQMRRLHALLLERGVNMVPRGLWFLSTEHSHEDIDRTLAAIDAAFAEL